jgi:hypothetical protein
MPDHIPWARFPVDEILWDSVRLAMEASPNMMFTWKDFDQAQEIHRTLVTGKTVDSSLVESVLERYSFICSQNTV